MSQLEQPILRRSIKAGVALKGQRFVEVDGTYPVANGHALGVTYTDAAMGAYVAVTLLGAVPVEANGAVAAGAAVTPDAAGKAGTAAGANQVVGRALEAAAADGDVIVVNIHPN